jgi:hypothetical protein
MKQRMFLMLLAMSVAHQKIYQYYWSFGASILSRTSSSESPTGNSYGSFGVQFRKKMLLMLMAMSVAHRRVDNFNIIDLLEPPYPPFSADLVCTLQYPNNSHPRPFNSSVEKKT